MENQIQNLRVRVCGKCLALNPDLMTDESGTYHDGCGSDDLFVFESKEEANKWIADIKKERREEVALKNSKIKEMMENYPEAGRGMGLFCHGWDYDKVEFSFHDEEEDKEYEVTLPMLQKGMALLLKEKPQLLNEDCDYDAYDCDELVQYAVFGEVRYG